MRSRRWIAAAVLGACLWAVPRPADAIVIEKIVAVVGEKAILLSDLRRRARPFMQRIRATIPDGPVRAAEESKMFTDLIERMVDEALENEAAMRVGVVVSSEDVDNALRNVAAMARLSLTQLFQDVQSNTGMTEQEYRAEIRRQVLEGKLVQRLVQDRYRITEQDLERMFATVVEQERLVRQFNPAWIVLQVGDGATAEQERERRKLAESIVARARAGEDFGALAEEFSDDAGSRMQGGDLGIRAPAQSPAAMAGKRQVLAPKLEKVALALEAGEISGPVRFKDAWVVLKVVTRQPSRYTTLDAAQRELVQRLKAEQLEKAKTVWLKDLRRRTHWETRR